MYLLVNKPTPLIGGFSQMLTEEEKKSFTYYEIDVEACRDFCEAIVASRGNSYLVSDESEIKKLYQERRNKQYFFKLEDKILHPLPVSENIKRHNALRSEVRQQEAFLRKTDWTVVKCLELGIAISEKYPDIHQQRTQARAQINQNEQQMNQL